MVRGGGGGESDVNFVCPVVCVVGNFGGPYVKTGETFVIIHTHILMVIFCSTTKVVIHYPLRFE